jgi:hypothetical protein
VVQRTEYWNQLYCAVNYGNLNKFEVSGFTERCRSSVLLIAVGFSYSWFYSLPNSHSWLRIDFGVYIGLGHPEWHTGHPGAFKTELTIAVCVVK